MYPFRYGGKTGKRYSLTTSNEHIVVRTKSRSALFADRPFEAAPISSEARALVNKFDLAATFRRLVEILRAKVTRGPACATAHARC
jgi:hypothetical protein